MGIFFSYVLLCNLLLSTPSDHSPILLNLDRFQPRGKKPFHFINAWTMKDGFLEVVKEAWGTRVFGNPIFVVVEKLKAVKVALKHWNRESFGNIETKVTQAREALSRVQSALAIHPDDVGLAETERPGTLKFRH